MLLEFMKGMVITMKKIVTSVLLMCLFFMMSSFAYALPTTTANLQVAEQAESDKVFAVQTDLGTYRLGKYDTVSVVIVGLNDGMNISGGAATPAAFGDDKRAGSGGTFGTGNILNNLTIGPDGYVTMPYVGILNLQGLTIPEAKDLIYSKLKRYVKIPSMEVVVVSYGPRRIMVVGSVGKPGIYDLQQDNLFAYNAITAAGGMLYNAANSHVRVIRMADNKVFIKEIDLDGYIQNLDFKQNLRIQDGDMLYVPRSGWKFSLNEDVMPLLSAWSTAYSVYALATK